MKKRLSAVVLMLAFFVTSAVAAENYKRTIEVENTGLIINGQYPTLTDVNGRPVSAFIHDGTTYVPIRAVSNAFSDYFDASISYSNQNNTAFITTQPKKDSPKSGKTSSDDDISRQMPYYAHHLSTLSNNIHTAVSEINAALGATVADYKVQYWMSVFDIWEKEISKETNEYSNFYAQYDDLYTLYEYVSDQFAAYDHALAEAIGIQTLSGSISEFGSYATDERTNWSSAQDLSNKIIYESAIGK